MDSYLYKIGIYLTKPTDETVERSLLHKPVIQFGFCMIFILRVICIEIFINYLNDTDLAMLGAFGHFLHLRKHS